MRKHAPSLAIPRASATPSMHTKSKRKGGKPLFGKSQLSPVVLSQAGQSTQRQLQELQKLATLQTALVGGSTSGLTDDMIKYLVLCVNSPNLLASAAGSVSIKAKGARVSPAAVVSSTV